jgi:DNA repair protein RadC
MATNKELLLEVNRQIVSDVKLIYRPKVKMCERPLVKCSEDAYRLFLDSWDMDTICLAEQSRLMLLNNARRVLGIMLLSQGGITGTVIDPRIVFLAALQAGATCIHLAHNHPSMRLEPSGNDKALTAKIKEAGAFLDIHLEDHLIISPDGYYSMADEGIL